MDWILWLTPLLLLLAVYPFVVFGCALDTQGTATPSSTRTLLLHFTGLPKLGQVPITGIQVTYALMVGKATITVEDVPKASVVYDSTGLAQGDVEPSQPIVPFDSDTPVQCFCRVTLERQAWGVTLSPIGPIEVTAATTNEVIGFTLTYSMWPGAPPPDYAPGNFQLSFDA